MCLLKCWLFLNVIPWNNDVTMTSWEEAQIILMCRIIEKWKFSKIYYVLELSAANFLPVPEKITKQCYFYCYYYYLSRHKLCVTINITLHLGFESQLSLGKHGIAELRGVKMVELGVPQIRCLTKKGVRKYAHFQAAMTIQKLLAPSS